MCNREGKGREVQGRRKANEFDTAPGTGLQQGEDELKEGNDMWHEEMKHRTSETRYSKAQGEVNIAGV